jgi:RNA polymerase sigma-70 factor (ECF subfamily)
VHADLPYLVRTLHNVLKDHWRTESRRPQIVGEVDESHPSGRDQLEARLLASDVAAALDELPRNMREVVTAVDVLGLSYQQTARTLRVPLGTVMSRLSRGRSRVALALA